ncbi:MAG: M20 family metallopeptidase [Candidatus Woesearchaeota archaeon]
MKIINIPDSKLIEINGNIVFIANYSLIEPSETIGVIVHYDILYNKNNLYKLKIENNYCFGAGISSAKGAIYQIINTLKNSKICNNKKLKIIFTKDETTGSKEGTKYLVDNYEKIIDADYYWIPDCTDKFISIGCYNILVHHILIFGDGGHPIYSKIKNNTNIETAKKILLLNEKIKKLNRNYSEENVLINFISTEVKNKNNIVPSTGEITIEYRINPKIKFIQLKKKINSIYNNLKIKKNSKLIFNGYLSRTQKSNNLIKIIKRQCPKVKKEIEKGNHDGAYIGFKLKKEVIGFLPGGKNLHMPTECVNMETLSRVGKIFQELIK